MTNAIKFATKLSLNLPMMALANKMGFYPFYGAVATTILGFMVSSVFCLSLVIKKHKLNIKPTVKEFGNIFIGVALMIGVMFILRLFVPLYVKSRVLSVLVAIFYALIGGLVYLIYMYKSKGINRIFGDEIVSKIKNRFIKK